MGRTFLIGERKPAVPVLQKQRSNKHSSTTQAQPQAPAQPLPQGQQYRYWVVTVAFGLALQGSKHFANQCTTGKCWGVFTTEQQARSYITQNKLRLVATVVALAQHSN